MKTQIFSIAFCPVIVLCVCLCGQISLAQNQDFSRTQRPAVYRSTESGSSSFASKTASDGSPIIACVVQLIVDVDVPARETGLLKDMLVVENQPVQLGQLLANIDDQMSQRALEQAKFKHELASRRATDPTEIQAAEDKLKLTQSEYETNYRLWGKGSKTKQEAQRSKYSRDISVHELTSARNSKELAEIEANTELVNVNAAHDSIARHKITSPVDGHVFKIYKDPGEWVNAGEKIMRIAPLSRLRVHGTISAKEWDPFEVDGKPVTVSVKLARGRVETFSGRVVQTELEQRGNNLYLVVAEIDNRYEPNTRHWILQPQSRVEMTIHVNSPAPIDNQSAAQPPASGRNR